MRLTLTYCRSAQEALSYHPLRVQGRVVGPSLSCRLLHASASFDVFGSLRKFDQLDPGSQALTLGNCSSSLLCLDVLRRVRVPS